MARAEPSNPDDTAPAFPGLSDAQLGSIVEGRVATAVELQAPGSATVACPLLDLGFDLYLRRIRTLRAHPLQVKARSFLGPDGQFEAAVGSLHLDPLGYVVLPYVPPPHWELSGKLWAIPIPDFVRLAQKDGHGYVFSSYVDRDVADWASQFLVDVAKLNRQWIAKIPGWSNHVPSPHEEGVGATEEVARPQTRALGKSGELWLASQLMRTGLNNVVIAQDRLRVDCVTTVLHHLPTYAIGGLVVHISSIDGRGHVQFQIRNQTFFMDPRLYVVLIVCQDDGAIHQDGALHQMKGGKMLSHSSRASIAMMQAAEHGA